MSDRTPIEHLLLGAFKGHMKNLNQSLIKWVKYPDFKILLKIDISTQLDVHKGY